MNPLGLRRSWRHLNRYQEILKVFVKYGFYDIVEKIRVGLLFDISKKILPRLEKKELATLGTAVRLRMALEELGPTFIKLGQMLSIRPDLIPPHIADEFSKLQDEVRPVSFDVVKPYIEAELGSSLTDLFSEFNQDAIAAASLAQVHWAKLKSGEEVAVKILRPNIQHVIETDLEILYDLARLLEKHIPESELYDPIGIVNEFSTTIRKEQNMIFEGRNIDLFRRHFKDDPTIKLPIVYWELTTEKILVTEYIKGIKISEIEILEKQEINLKEVANNGAQLILKMVFECGVFHADPHPGNIFVLPGNVLAPVDFGMVGRIDEEMKECLVNILRGIVDKDTHRISRTLLKIGMIEDQIDRRKLNRELLEFLDRYYRIPLNQLSTPQLLNEFLVLIRNFRIKLPSDLVMMGKALAISEGVGRKIYPEFNMFELIVPYSEKLLLHRLDPFYQFKNFSRFMETGIDFLGNLPDDFRLILTKLKKDQITIKFQHQGLEHLTRELDRASNRLAFSLIIAALLIGSSMLIQFNKGPFLFGYPALGIIGFLLASFMGIWLLISIMRSGKL